MSIVFHIGSGKCGSSALQSALTWRDLSPVDQDRKVVYAAMSFNHGLVHGPELRKLAGRSSLNYVASNNISKLITLSQADQADLIAKTRALSEECDTLILSCEGAYTQVLHPERVDFLRRLQVPIHAIMYVRPQVPLINSAWWQWGAWTKDGIDDFVSKQLRTRKWHRFVENWELSGLFDSLQVRVLPKDVVSDFLNLIGLDASSDDEVRANSSLRGDVLRVYQRNRHLRNGPHNPAMDFVLERHLPKGRKAPWVISTALAKSIIEDCMRSNKKLQGMLDHENAAAMAADPAWWDVAAFSDKVVEPAGPIPIDPAEVDALVADMAQALLLLDKQIRSQDRRRD